MSATKKVCICRLTDAERAEPAHGEWRVGGKVPLNVYKGDTPMFQCHTPEDAARIVVLLNQAERAKPDRPPAQTDGSG
jgi:hypothetical protein